MELLSMTFPPGLTDSQLSELMLANERSSTSLLTLVQAVSIAGMGILLGMITVQASVYYRTFRDDGKLFKGVVALLIFLSFSDFALYVAQLVLLLKNPYSTIMMKWQTMNFTEWLFLALTACITQIFFATRLYRLLRKPLWFWFVAGPMILASFTAGLLFCAFGWTAEMKWLLKLPVTGNTWAACTLITDLCITATMLWAIARNNGVSQHSDGWLYRVLFVVVESITLPVVCLAVYLGLYNFYAHNCASWDRVVSAFQAPLYAQAVIYSLNQRQTIKAYVQASSHGGSRLKASGGAESGMTSGDGYGKDFKGLMSGEVNSPVFWEEKDAVLGREGVHVELQEVPINYPYAAQPTDSQRRLI